MYRKVKFNTKKDQKISFDSKSQLNSKIGSKKPQTKQLNAKNKSYAKPKEVEEKKTAKNKMPDMGENLVHTDQEEHKVPTFSAAPLAVATFTVPTGVVKKSEPKSDDSFMGYQHIDDPDTKALIEQMLAEEQKHNKELEEQEKLNLAFIEELKKLEEEEMVQRRHRASTYNKPQCKICYDQIPFKEIFPLNGCTHIFHKDCMVRYIEQKVDSKNFPIDCPECRLELEDFEVKHFCSKDLYNKLAKFQFQLFVEQNGDMMINCPTPDGPFVFEWGTGARQDQKFRCNACDKTHGIYCRVEWHEGISGSDYRKLNKYPHEDRAFFKFIQGTKFKECPKGKFWVERTEGCNHMTCRCKFEFGYRCGKAYKNKKKQGKGDLHQN